MTRRTLLALLLIAALSIAQSQRKGSRYDNDIRAAVDNVLKSHTDFKNVKADVGDNVVTLLGTVELDSTRQRLVDQIRKIKHVHSVRNELVLYPPAPPDLTLSGRVRQTLADLRLESITFQVHEGVVELSGIVRNEQERERAIERIRSTEGVKEVRNKLTVAGD